MLVSVPGNTSIEDFPETVKPDPGALLASLAGTLQDDDLRIIAQADFGRDLEDHLTALRGIAQTGHVPCPLPWTPREVLELVRWDEPPPDPKQEQRHWRHAFACCTLVRAFGDADNQSVLFGENQSLIGLVDSLRTLSSFPLTRARQRLLAQLDRQATALLAWLIPRLPEGETGEHAFFGLGLLWFALATDVPDAALHAVTAWLMRMEDAIAAPWREEGGAPGGGTWLLGTTVYNLRHKAWRALGQALPERLQKRHGMAVVEDVRLISAMLAERG